jgi:hypothetical protein
MSARNGGWNDPFGSMNDDVRLGGVIEELNKIESDEVDLNGRFCR